MKSKQLPLNTNLLEQNCYIRDIVLRIDKQSSTSELFYDSINEVTDGMSLRHEVVQVPYEITPQYVNSFVDSADYRNNPVAAIVNAPHRTNLGDIREYQQINEMDDTQASKLYAQLKERFSKAQAQAQAQAQTQAQTQSEISDSEVK